MLAAPRSGSGKTTLTCAVLRALVNRKKKPAAFKCGPDYIDPMFHRHVLGIPAGNLDTFFTEDKVTKFLFGKKAREADLSVIEGVMGFYDGMGLTSEKASSYELAKVLETPVVLVVDGKGMSLSLAAEIKGFLDYRRDSGIRGVILNRVSKAAYSGLKKYLEQELGIQVFGYVPVLKEAALESRHLGLVIPEEVKDLKTRIEKLSLEIEKTVDIDGLIHLAESAGEFSFSGLPLPKLEKTVRIGVARDEAFCFYYQENLDLLREMGAELIFFSPLRDERLPEHLAGLLFGGGYPELYAERLGKNGSLLSEIRDLLKDRGIPCLAECGGYLYLCRQLEDMAGNVWPMAGALPADGYRTDSLKRFGYVELTARGDTVLGQAGLVMKGHEFHYFDSTDNGAAFVAKKPLRDAAWDCIHGKENLAAGFPHFYYYSNPEAVFHYLRRCMEYG